MAYRRSRWESKDGRFRIEKKYYSYRAMPLRPEIKEKRAKRQNVTKETQAAVNCRLRAEKLSRLLVDNFHTGDWYLTCTYREKPDADEVQRDFEKFKRKVRSIYKKAGVEARYISVLENLTGAGRPHGHILLPALDAKDLEKVQAAWPHGSVAIKLYGGHLADADRLARYFTKEKVVAHAGRLQTSRNLLRREPKVVTVTRAEAFQTDFQPPKGYRIIKELSYSTYTAEGYPLTLACFERTEESRCKNARGQRDEAGDLHARGANAVCGGTRRAKEKAIRSGGREESDGAAGSSKHGSSLV